MIVRTMACLCLALIAASATLGQDIVARPGDVLEISVLGEESLSGKVPVRDDGTIALPLIGDVEVAGQHPSAITTLLAQRLADYIKDPQVSVQIAERAPLKVVIAGEVKSPGVYFVPCDTRLAEALAQCGGATPDADLSHIALTRSGEKPRDLDFARFLNDGDETQNPLLVSGDHIRVPRSSAASTNTLRVMGKVARPGLYEAKPGLTPWDLVSLAGGLAPGADPRRTVLKRANGESQEIDLTALLDPQAMVSAPVLAPGDALVIPALGTQVYLLGAVRNPGPYSLEQGTRLFAAIAAAGGVTETAELEKAYLLRDAGGQQNQVVKHPVNLRRLLVQGDLSADLDLKTGDVLFVPVRSSAARRSALEHAAPVLGPLIYLLF